MLEMLKTDLGIVSPAYDTRLQQYLDSAQTEIIREGASLDLTNISDMQLVVAYAAWMWRRRDEMTGMPRMLRYQLNNKVLAGKMR